VLGARAYELARRQPWAISPAVILELEILSEIGRMRATPERVIEAARTVGDLAVSDATFEGVAAASRPLSWTRDPIDRLVTAQAIVDGAKLLTADRTILTHFADAVWD
jgi:PIN domain nuclease of toxin-antitoxin system